MNQEGHSTSHDDYQDFIDCANQLRADDIDLYNPWKESPLDWVKTLSSGSFGALSKTLVTNLCRNRGFDVSKSPSPQADRLLEGFRIQIKSSRMWEEGIYKFQQIRDQEYDFLFCLGISPLDVHAWALPKEVLDDHVIGHSGQHLGAGARDTFWISFKVGQEYAWMRPYGGSLADFYRAIDLLVGYS